MSPPPVRVLANAIRVPSGENAGSRSLPGPVLTVTRPDPSGIAVAMRAPGTTKANPPSALCGAACADPRPAPHTRAAKATAEVQRHRVIRPPSQSTLVRSVTLSHDAGPRNL